MQADLLLAGGRVRTLDAARPSGTAVAIGDGRILLVGDDAEALELRGVATEVVGLRGAAVVPGLTDAHLHPFLGARRTRGADLLERTDLDDVRAQLRAERERVGAGAWVLGWGLEYNAFARTEIHRREIEEACGDGPAVLVFMDAHVALANAAALALAGIDGPRAFGEASEVVCDAEGAPTGELREWAAVDLVLDVVPPLGPDEEHAAYVRTLRELTAVGLTGVHAMDGGLEELDLLRRLEAEGDLPLRMISPFWVTPEDPDEHWQSLLPHRDAHGERWRAGVAKLFIDGVIDAGTGWLHEPDALGEGLEPFWPDPARYREAVATFARAGFQCVTHATGDRGVHEALDAYAAVPAPRRGHHRIEHLETVRPEELGRLAAEGVVASMQAQHMMWLDADRSDNWSRRLGRERAAGGRAFPTRSLLESGALIALGSDWPVARFDPRIGLAAARLRRPPGERDRAPFDDEALTALQALDGYTTGAARAVGDEDRRGRIAPGLDADLTVLEADPVDCDADALPELDVRLTVVGGEVVHRSTAW